MFDCTLLVGDQHLAEHLLVPDDHLVKGICLRKGSLFGLSSQFLKEL